MLPCHEDPRGVNESREASSLTNLDTAQEFPAEIRPLAFLRLN